MIRMEHRALIFFCFVVSRPEVGLGIGLKSTEGRILKDFPPAILHRHIQESRHVPVCLVFRNTSKDEAIIERTSWTLWKEGLKEKKVYSDWQLGSLSVDQAPVVGIEGNLPPFRCYLSPRRYKDYHGKGDKKGLTLWLQKQVQSYDHGLIEGSLSAVQNATHHHKFTVVGFASFGNHFDIEETLAELHEEWSPLYPVFFVHPHNQDIIELFGLCETSWGDSLVILSRAGPASSAGLPIYKLESQSEITKHNVKVFLTARNIPALHIDQNNFQTLLEESRHYVPTIVCLYAWWAPGVLSYLGAYKRAIEELETLNINLRYALLEVNTKSQYVVAQHIDPTTTSNLPAVVLFSTKWERKKVVGIKQEVFAGHLPTPGELTSFLHLSSMGLVSASGRETVYQPWGHTAPSEMSLLSEGPFGKECTPYSHNETDSSPKYIKLKPPVVKKIIHPKRRQTQDKVYKNPVESLLERVGGVAMVTDELWQDVIERSHAPSHPLYKSAEWRGEVTQVTLVIFIITDCASCRRHMKLFTQLNGAISTVEGGNVYLMNCTSDPLQCARHHISGFPTLAVFRGIGWLHGEQCFSSSASSSRPYRQFNYHGALLLDHVMNWFAQTAAPAVEKLRFQEPEWDETTADVWLVAYIIPRRSDYLHKARITYRHLYHYKCFRLACERLYGQAACFIQYSPNVPPSEFEEAERSDDMTITQVILERRDGLSTQVMRLGEPLLDTLEEESQNAIHKLHSGHDYDVRRKQRCEDDPVACTDYVVHFSRDHARLSVSPVSMTTFHSPDSVLTGHSLPILIAFAHKDNLTEEAKFYKTLTTVGRLLYQDVVTVSVAVDHFMSWANRFVPRGYSERIFNGAEPFLYYYPRFCLVYWKDHHRAAFYPGVEVAPLVRYKHKDILAFVRSAISKPESAFIETEHF